MTTLVRLEAVAEALGLSAAYVRRIAADQGRPSNERRYDAQTHSRFPVFFKDGNSTRWVTTAETFGAHLRRRGKQWEPTL